MCVCVDIDISVLNTFQGTIILHLQETSQENRDKDLTRSTIVKNDFHCRYTGDLIIYIEPWPH